MVSVSMATFISVTHVQIHNNKVLQKAIKKFSLCKLDCKHPIHKVNVNP